ncbi:hypothetical protein [Streptomyces sp. NPDC002851]
MAISVLTAASPAHAESISFRLRSAVAALPVADEDRTGYDRDLFRHWIDADHDGCSTRSEVLLEEAVEAPTVTGRCTLNGGRWYSWYDDTYVDHARALDIDHLVSVPATA